MRAKNKLRIRIPEQPAANITANSDSERDLANPKIKRNVTQSHHRAHDVSARVPAPSAELSDLSGLEQYSSRTFKASQTPFVSFSISALLVSNEIISSARILSVLRLFLAKGSKFAQRGANLFLELGGLRDLHGQSPPPTSRSQRSRRPSSGWSPSP